VIPTHTTHYFFFPKGVGGPRAISVNDSTLAAFGREEDMSGNLFAVEKIEVTIYPGGTSAPQVSAYGRRLTKAGKLDSRESYYKLVSMDTVDDERFIQYAQAVMNPNLTTEKESTTQS
jgi:hypothetical protein